MVLILESASGECWVRTPRGELRLEGLRRAGAATEPFEASIGENEGTTPVMVLNSQRSAKSDSAAPVGSSALDEATFYLRTVGLTWRELGILREMELLSREGKRLERAALADRLGVSPNTLRVHLTRIRAKLDVGDRRGDEVLLSAALTQRPVA